MTQTTKLQSEFGTLTKSSGFQYIESQPPITTTSSGAGNIIFCEFRQGPSPVVPDAAVDIDKFISDLEKDPESRGLIAQGRQWISRELYEDQPRSLKYLRLAKGLSQAQLASLVGTSQSHIARLESGTTEPQVSTVLKLADALAMEANELFLAFAESIDVDRKIA